MRVLVTGATGFIGNYVIRELLENNHEVIASSRNRTMAETKDWFSQVTFLPFLLDNIDDNTDLFQYFNRPDLLIHLAWSGLPNYRDFSHIDKNLFQQFRFVQNLLNNGLKDLLITGTCFEYGMQSGPLHEAMITLPDNPYAIAKDSLRKFIETYQKTVPFNFKWARLFYMYGAGQSPRSLMSMLERDAANGETVFKMSGGEQLRDFLKVTEVAKILVKIATQNAIQGVINCCSGKPVSVRNLVEQYVDDHHLNISLQLGYYPYPDYEPMAFWGDSGKLNKII